MLAATTAPDGGSYDDVFLASLIAEFMDLFHALEGDRVMQQVMVQAAPELTGFAEVDALLAALGEHLSLQSGLIVPKWVHEPERRATSARGFPMLADLIYQDVPLAFRKRNITLRG